MQGISSEKQRVTNFVANNLANFRAAKCRLANTYSLDDERTVRLELASIKRRSREIRLEALGSGTRRKAFRLHGRFFAENTVQHGGAARAWRAREHPSTRSRNIGGQRSGTSNPKT